MDFQVEEYINVNARPNARITTDSLSTLARPKSKPTETHRNLIIPKRPSISLYPLQPADAAKKKKHFISSTSERGGTSNEPQTPFQLKCQELKKKTEFSLPMQVVNKRTFDTKNPSLGNQFQTPNPSAQEDGAKKRKISSPSNRKECRPYSF